MRSRLRPRASVVARLAGVPLGLIVAAVAAANAQSAGPSSVPTKNHLPVVTSTLKPRVVFSSRAPVRFNVTVSDADGDLASARVVNGPHEMGFAPITNAPSGVAELSDVKLEYTAFLGK